ncbi:MAG TPA: hypothetical protein VKZ55_08760 [Microthrixaceae bacterium]|nr:hypothetical protein [Microthrixaceae bacterium]
MSSPTPASAGSDPKRREPGGRTEHPTEAAEGDRGDWLPKGADAAVDHRVRTPRPDA